MGTRPVFAQSNQLVLTENSSTSLSVTYNGSTTGILVGLIAPDQWLVALPVTISQPQGFTGLQWFEPENISLFNNVKLFGSSPTNVLTVVSDAAVDLSLVALPDGRTWPIGVDSSDMPILATFNDNAATAESVPEPSTIGLLLFGLTASLGLRRFRSRLSA
jgi:hypothetical protein